MARTLTRTHTHTHTEYTWHTIPTYFRDDFPIFLFLIEPCTHPPTSTVTSYFGNCFNFAQPLSDIFHFSGNETKFLPTGYGSKYLKSTKVFRNIPVLQIMHTGLRNLNDLQPTISEKVQYTRGFCGDTTEALLAKTCEATYYLHANRAIYSHAPREQNSANYIHKQNVHINYTHLV